MAECKVLCSSAANVSELTPLDQAACWGPGREQCQPSTFASLASGPANGRLLSIHRRPGEHRRLRDLDVHRLFLSRPSTMAAVPSLGASRYSLPPPACPEVWKVGCSRKVAQRGCAAVGTVFCRLLCNRMLRWHPSASHITQPHLRWWSVPGFVMQPALHEIEVLVAGTAAYSLSSSRITFFVFCFSFSSSYYTRWRASC